VNFLVKEKLESTKLKFENNKFTDLDVKQFIEFDKQSTSGNLSDRNFIWNENTLDFWMHSLWFLEIQNVLSSLGDVDFLTVGDIRATQGMMLKKLSNIKRVDVSDIADGNIKVAKQRGLIDDCFKENLCKLSFKDNSYDYVLAKECLHHLTRPYLGIYEMLRVASKGIIFIEPNGDNDLNQHPAIRYETEAGNFAYRFKSYEMIQAAAALNMKAVAYTYSPFPYLKVCELRKTGITDSEIKNTIMESQKIIDGKHGKRQRDHLICVMLFEMSDEIKKSCVDNGMTVVEI
jgi:2-polyprenyl-3-methyl-5-hydroxy-6-metoxy-1,4-benzoquinol methylase